MADRNDDLGMGRAIDRRDFINGFAAATAAGVIGVGGGEAQAKSAEPLPPDYYPPKLQGIRGSHEGSFEAAHALRDAKSFAALQQSATNTGETYDLVVAGAGISGLAAAYFYRQQHGPSAKILILDNHDDFGGHAKRNEFTYNGRTFIGYGGTEQIYHGPWEYGPDSLGLLKDIGIDTDRFYTAFDWTRYDRMQLKESLFFDKETFGRDYLAVGERQIPWPEFLKATPLPAKAQEDLIKLYENSVDYMPGVPVQEKLARLEKMTYNEFLRDVAKVDPMVIPYLRSRTGRGVNPTDHSGALSARSSEEISGLEGMGLPAARKRWKRYPEQIFHFPDGNAGVARLLVRSLIPSALKAKDMEESVTARVNYAQLDQASSPIRLRLSSTVVNAHHVGGGPAASKEVEITYINHGQAYRVRAANVVLACYNALIPAICPEMPEAQKKGLAHAVKSPLIYANVLVSNWRPWKKLGIHFIHNLTGYFHEYKLDFPVDLGTYKASANPDEPIVLHVEKRYWDAGPRAWENTARSTQADRNKMGRAQLLATPFEDFERDIRGSLGRMLAGTDFDPAKDILGITVNRWPHGYAVGRDAMNEENWPEAQRPWVIGRAPFGRITVANSDSGAGALTQIAIDQALRAVKELNRAGS